MSNRYFLYIPPLILIVIFISSYYIYVVFLCALVINNLLESCLYLLFHNIIFVMLLWAFLSTVFTPVAKVPIEYKLTDEEIEICDRSNLRDRDLILQNISVKKNLVLLTHDEHGYIRYCKICKLIKPDRAHHCSTCKVCVLKMDHHCPWVNNCIGFSNFKCFILLLFYCSIYCAYTISTSYKYFIHIWNGEETPNDKQYLPVVVGLLISALIGVAGSIFLLFNCGLLFKNKTTLENMRSPTFMEANVDYNLGCKRNFMEVFGENWQLWLLPFFTGLGTGYTFPINRQ